MVQTQHISFKDWNPIGRFRTIREKQICFS